MRYGLKVYDVDIRRKEIHECDGNYNNSADLLLAFSRALLDEEVHEIHITKGGNIERSH